MVGGFQYLGWYNFVPIASRGYGYSVLVELRCLLKPGSAGANLEPTSSSLRPPNIRKLIRLVIARFVDVVLDPKEFVVVVVLFVLGLRSRR